MSTVKTSCWVLLILTYLVGLPSQAQWTTAKLSGPRNYLAATSVGSKALFGGGLVNNYTSTDKVEIFDVATQAWSKASLSQARWNLLATSAGSKAFFAGGMTGSLQNPLTPSDRVDIYDDATGLWSTASLSIARANFAATSAGSKVFFGGGLGLSNVVDIYDTATGLWTTTTLSQGRYNLAATSAGSKVFFVGGKLANDVMSNVVDIYDTTTELWTTRTLPNLVGFPIATSVGTKVFFSGDQTNIVDIYDVATNVWSTATLSKIRFSLSATRAGTKAFFAGGGFLPPGEYAASFSDVVDIYDYATDQWTTDKLPRACLRLASTSIGKQAFFAGGEPALYTTSDEVYIYTIRPPLNITPSKATLTSTSPSVSLSAVGEGTLKWSTGATTPVISATTAGIYSVTLTNAEGDTASASATVIGQDLSPTLLLPQANFPAAGSEVNLVVAVAEVGGFPTSLGNVSITITVPTGFTVSYDPSLTAINVTGGENNPVMVNNSEWRITSNTSNQQIRLTINEGLFIAANATTNLGFTVTRTSANSGSTSNITVNVANDKTKTFDGNSANNIYARIISGL
ncbi:hypothetical protein EXU85_22060 [Spirosoma sp. KCTC 42546]|uniref:Kelch repeat-containing protein n=1 Tax=Spirosoma sp. KCTC 42546 TaxID=2520506 RepID=UPI001158526B|nr:hypothetical protein [Spirosoma sp. KCTC 42546]QDK81153.1 hypothetical protein EXU85_22060 [Spirosoma sp. KCTC 42546]